MKLQRTVGAWTCLPASFATLLGLTLGEVLAEVGHDGSEVVWPHLTDPERRRSFHPQEMIDLAERYGVAITPIEARPAARPNLPGCRIYEVDLDNVPRFQKHLEGTVGVITGRNLIGRRHAVVWDGDQVLDPASGETYGLYLFQPEVFWKARTFTVEAKNRGE